MHTVRVSLVAWAHTASANFLAIWAKRVARHARQLGPAAVAEQRPLNSGSLIGPNLWARARSAQRATHLSAASITRQDAVAAR